MARPGQAVSMRGLAHAAARPRRCVLISRLPRTALPDDVRRLGDRGALAGLEFFRTPHLAPTGSALALVAPGADAYAFAAAAHARMLGEQPLTARTLHDREAAWIRGAYRAPLRAELRLALDIAHAEPARAVLLRGLPEHTTPEKLDTKLRRSYALAGAADERLPLAAGALSELDPAQAHPRLLPSIVRLPPPHPDSTAAWFLVRFASVAEAMRLVRSWHRTHYSPQKYGVERTGDRYVVDAELLY